MSDFLSKRDLLDKIRTARADLENALASLTDAQMIQPGILGDWSVKDILSHLIFWEQKMLHRIQTGIVPQPAPGETWDQMIDRMNDENYRATRDESLDAVRAEFQNSYAEALAFIGALSNEDLNDPEKYEFWRGEPIWKYMRGDTYEHYQEHAAPIRAWNNSVKGG
jgi:uncharacterized protein (TIGR03083 family)